MHEAKFYCYSHLPNEETEAYGTSVIVSKKKEIVNGKIKIWIKTIRF